MFGSSGAEGPVAHGEVTWEGQRRASPTKARVLAKRIRAVAAWARLSLPRETVRQQLRVDRPLPFAGIRSRVCRRKRDHGSVRHAFKTKPQNQRGLCCGFILEHAYVERIGSVAYGEGYPDQRRSLAQNRDLAKEDAPKICGTRDLIQFNLPRHGAPLVCGETASAIRGLRENGRQAFLRLPATPVHGICCGREKDKGEAGWFDVGGEEVKRSVLHGLHIQSCAPDFRNHQDVDELFRLGRQLENVLKGTIRKPGIGENH